MHPFLFECRNCGEHGVDESKFRKSIRDEFMVRELDTRLRDAAPNTQARLVFEGKCPLCDPKDPEDPEDHVGTLKIGVLK